jgi:hypothetical protein
MTKNRRASAKTRPPVTGFPGNAAGAGSDTPAAPRVKVAKKELWRAIRAKCVDCCCGQYAEVRACQVSGCALWPYREAGR